VPVGTARFGMILLVYSAVMQGIRTNIAHKQAPATATTAAANTLTAQAIYTSVYIITAASQQAALALALLQPSY
jgi:hypothetical protein